MPKVMLGYAVPDAPQFYRNFIYHHRQFLPRPMTKSTINELLAKEPCRVVLRRRRRGDPDDGSVYLLRKRTSVPRSEHWGQWYLDFGSERDHILFRMRWS